MSVAISFVNMQLSATEDEVLCPMSQALSALIAFAQRASRPNCHMGDALLLLFWNRVE